MRAQLRITALISLTFLGGCREAECLDAVLAPPSRAERFVFTATDFTSSVLGVLDVEGQIINPPLISSGSTPPGALSALSGDVALATEQPNDRLLYVERLGADLITEVTRTGWYVQQQSRVSQLGEDGSTFSANPQDMLSVGDDRYWVTRHNPNNESSAAFAGGNDIAIVSRPDGLVFDTIPLAAANTASGESVIYARPGRMVFSASEDDSNTGVVTVGLARLSEDFQVAGPGAVAFVNTASRTVTLLALNPLTNCGEVRPVLEEPNQVLVVCKGNTFMAPDARRATSGVALIDVVTRQLLQLWRADAHAEVLPPQHGLVSLGGTQVVVVGISEGDGSTQIESQLIGIDLSSGATLPIATSLGEQLGLGAGAFDPDTNVLLVPDSNRTEFAPDAIRRFDRNAGLVFTERAIPPGSTCDELTIREVALLPLRVNE